MLEDLKTLESEGGDCDLRQFRLNYYGSTEAGPQAA